MGGWLTTSCSRTQVKIAADKDGVESGGEGGIDVGARAVADHPCDASFAAMVIGEREIGFVVLLGQDLDGGEVGR